MSLRLQLLLLAALVILVVLAWAFPRPAGADVPAGRSMIPSSEFVPVRTAGIAVVGTNNPSPAVHQSRTPSPVAVGSPSPVPSLRLAAVRVPTPSVTGTPKSGDVSRGFGIAGVASWFASPIGVSAAGPALRAAIGAGWRGTVVTVTADGFSVRTQLGDWCACGDRHGVPTVIDLDVAAFRQLAPLSIGVIAVEVDW